MRSVIFLILGLDTYLQVCLFSPKMKRTSERIVKFHSLAQFVSNFSDNSVSSFTVSWV